MVQDPFEMNRWLAKHILPHEAALRLWLRKIGLGDGFEQDVVQEAYCKLLSAGDLEHIRDGRAYLFAIARSIALQRLRREKIVRFEAIAQLDGFEPQDMSPVASDILEDREQLTIARKLIESLPDRCREVFILRRLHGLSQRETASRLGITENVVEKQIARGLALLVEAMAEHGFERTLVRKCSPDADPSLRKSR